MEGGSDTWKARVVAEPVNPVTAMALTSRVCVPTARELLAVAVVVAPTFSHDPPSNRTSYDCVLGVAF